VPPTARSPLVVFAGMRSQLTLLSLVAAGCTSKWDLIIYEDKSNLADESKWHRTFGYESLEACRSEALTQMSRNRETFPNADYECARDCKPMRPGSSVQVCDETTR